MTFWCILYPNKAATLLWHDVFYHCKCITIYEVLNTGVTVRRRHSTTKTHDRKYHIVIGHIGVLYVQIVGFTRINNKKCSKSILDRMVPHAKTLWISLYFVRTLILSTVLSSAFSADLWCGTCNSVAHLFSTLLCLNLQSHFFFLFLKMLFRTCIFFF